MYQSVYLILWILLAAASAVAQPAPAHNPAGETFPITLVFRNQLKGDLLSFDSSYTTAQGETFRIRHCRYYISHLALTGENGRTCSFPDTYFLVDERKPESKLISLRAPFRRVASVHFYIGVDSSRNVGGVQTGALDPANGMFWTWNSGYIFAKLEGTAPQSKAPGHNFTYHIGGFRHEENAIREVTLPLPARELAANVNTDTITIAADIATWLGNIQIAATPSIMQPGPSAMQMADRYRHMFRIVP